MRPPVLTKTDMYSRIVKGEFGNTLPRYFSIAEWEGPGLAGAWMDYELWGVQHTTIPGFPGTRLDVRRRDVRTVIREGGFGENYCISPMVHQAGNVLWEGDVCRRHDGPGVLCSGHFNPALGSWRQHMKHPVRWEGTAGAFLLRCVLNDNSYDDLQVLLDEYPDHVVEFSALDACFGTCLGRNAVVWEVRKY
jgi:hypothetical protein